jgi:hypothetical protein
MIYYFFSFLAIKKRKKMGYAYLTFLYGNELGTQDATDFSHFKKSKRSLNDFLYVKGHKLNGFVDFEELMEELYEKETFENARNLIYEVKNNNEIHIFEFENTGEIKLENLIYLEKFTNGKWVQINEKIKGEININYNFSTNDYLTPYFKPNSFDTYKETKITNKILEILNQGGTTYSKEGYYFFIRNAPISTITDEMIIYSAQARCLNVVNSTRLQAIEAIKATNDLKCNQEILKNTIGSQTYEREKKITKKKKRKSLKKTTKKRKSSKKTTKKRKSSKIKKSRSKSKK